VRLSCTFREIRRLERTSLGAISEIAGIHRGTLSLIERGRLLPTDEQIPGLELAYGRPIETLYSPLALRAVQEDDDA
jgi:transcriptional regulator with XRE-family HTH domain